MRLARRRQGRTIWLLVLSLLVALLAPGLSHALRDRAAGWIEICSVAGSRWLPAETTAASSCWAPACNGNAMSWC